MVLSKVFCVLVLITGVSLMVSLTSCKNSDPVTSSNTKDLATKDSTDHSNRDSTAVSSNDSTVKPDSLFQFIAPRNGSIFFYKVDYKDSGVFSNYSRSYVRRSRLIDTHFPFASRSNAYRYFNLDNYDTGDLVIWDSGTIEIKLPGENNPITFLSQPQAFTVTDDGPGLIATSTYSIRIRGNSTVTVHGVDIPCITLEYEREQHGYRFQNAFSYHEIYQLQYSPVLKQVTQGMLITEDGADRQSTVKREDFIMVGYHY